MTDINKKLILEFQTAQTQNKKLLKEQLDSLKTEPRQIIEQQKQNVGTLAALNSQLKQINQDVFQSSAAKETKGILKRFFKG